MYTPDTLVSVPQSWHIPPRYQSAHVLSTALRRSDWLAATA